MKKLIASMLAAALLLPAVQGFAADYTLSLNLPIPPVHKRWTNALKPWVEELERRSGGRIKVEPYFAEALSKQGEAYDSVKNGLADMTESSFTVAFGQFPYHERMADFTDVTRSQDHPTEILLTIQKEFPVVMKELEGAKLLFTHCLPIGMLIGTIKPVTSIEDLRGMKIACIGGAVAAAKVNALGASAVTMPAGEVYMALQQGIVDGATCDFQLLVSRRFGDLIKHLLPLNLVGGPFYCAMSQEIYDDMPEDLQKVIDDMSGEYAVDLFEKFWNDDQYESARIWRDDMKGEIHFLTEDEYSKAAALVEPVQQEWIDKLNELGLPGDAIAARTRELEAQYNAKWNESRLHQMFAK